jgi:3-hydroxybutyryl-CoA dehydrogenase
MRVTKVGVLGAGTMGAAIAELFAFNGLPVVLRDLDASLVHRGLARVQGLVDELLRYEDGRAAKELGRIVEATGPLTAEQEARVRAKYAPKFTAARGAEVVGRVTGTTDPEAFRDVDLVVEAVFEREETKRAALLELDRIVPDHALLATNTSSLSVTRLARGLKHAPQTLVLHFFNPPSTLPLVEVSGGIETREEVVEASVDWLRGLRNHRYPLVPVRTKESPGFVVNRILIPVLNEACFALDEQVASARDIDLAAKSGAGFPMGPFELADLIGLDIVLDVAETFYRDFADPKYRPSPLLRRLVAAGHLGRKSGRGFYEYAAERGASTA